MRTLLLAGLALLASSTAAQGGPWVALAGGTDAPVFASATAPDGSVYIGGEFTTAGGLATDPVARWDGTSWHTMPGLDGSVYALAVGVDGSVLAAGTLTDSGAGQPGCASVWEGTAWEPLGTACGSIGEVYSAAFLPDGSPVVGGRDFGFDYGIFKWDGEAWTHLGSGSQGRLQGNVWALAVSADGTLYAGGEFFRIDGEDPPSCVAQWGGHAWQTTGTNLRQISPSAECVFSLAFDSEGVLHAGGNFQRPNDGTHHGLARLRDGAWTMLPLADGSAFAQTIFFASDGRLYTGRFSSVVFAVRNGPDWSVLWDVQAGGLYTIAEDATGRLILGGDFEQMGGIESSNLVGYDPLLVSSEPPPADTQFAVYPNPTAGPATIRTAAGGRAEVLDALGRVLWSGDVQPGTTDLPTAGLAPGVYVVRLVTGDATATQRLVVGR